MAINTFSKTRLESLSKSRTNRENKVEAKVWMEFLIPKFTSFLGKSWDMNNLPF
jgi:hypothetical protein